MVTAILLAVSFYYFCTSSETALFLSIESVNHYTANPQVTIIDILPVAFPALCARALEHGSTQRQPNDDTSFTCLLYTSILLFASLPSKLLFSAPTAILPPCYSCAQHFRCSFALRQTHSQHDAGFLFKLACPKFNNYF